MQQLSTEAIDLLRRLSELDAPPGFEEPVRRELSSLLADVTEEEIVDSMGNLILKIAGSKSNGPRVMLTAHMDEVALIVRYVDEHGFLYPASLGGLDARVLLGQRVIVHGSKRIEGCIGAKPPHIQTADEMKRSPDLKELYIDIGASSREEVYERGVDIGTPITFASSFSRLSERRVAGKAFDDRAGCAAAVLAIKRLSEEGLGCELYAVFTSQEELGLRGAATAANRVKPDFAFVLEGTVAADVPGVQQSESITRLGNGAAIRVMDASMLTSRKMISYLQSVAKIVGAKYQLQLYTGGATDAGRIHISGIGVETGVLATPCRYLHSPTLVLDLADLESVALIAYGAVKNIESYTSTR